MNDTDVKEAYERLGEAVPDVGDPDVVVRRVRRRRFLTGLGAGVPALVAVVLAATLAFGQLWPSGGQGVQVASQPSGLGLEDWAEPQSSTNGAARVGTLIHFCGSNCVRLRKPDGREIDLARERPDLASLIKGPARDNAALSWDAQWLGIPVGRSYQLHKLTDRDRSISVPDGPAGSMWQAVGWSPDSRYVALAAFESKRVVRYAWVTLASGKVTTYDPAPGAQALPERLDVPDGVVIASPIDTSRPVDERMRVTKLAADVLRLTGDGKGTVRQLYDPAPDLARYLDADETLAGPRGVAASSCAPAADGASRPLCATIVWGALGDGLRATGAVQTLAPEQPTKAVRWNLPRSWQWDYVGLLPTGEIAMSHLTNGGTEDDDLEIIAIDQAGQRRVISRVPIQSAVLLPGMALPTCCRDW
jgi:hypothetical protein